MRLAAGAYITWQLLYRNIQYDDIRRLTGTARKTQSRRQEFMLEVFLRPDLLQGFHQFRIAREYHNLQLLLIHMQHLLRFYTQKVYPL